MCVVDSAEQIGEKRLSSSSDTPSENQDDRQQQQEQQQQGEQSLSALLICTVGICGCYLWYGYLQEYYFREKKVGANFMLVSQCFTNVLVAVGWQRVADRSNTATNAKTNSDSNNDTATSSPQRSLHHSLLLLTSFCYVGAMSLSNSAFRYVSYPTAVLAKSCKLIPTMVMGFFIEKKRYSYEEWTAAGCITIGIVLFNLSRIQQQQNQNQNSSERENSTIGVLLLVCSLCFDGFLGSCQGLLKRPDTSDLPHVPRRPPSAMETMLYVNLYALLWLFPLAYLTGEWAEGLARWDEEDLRTGVLCLNTAAAAGQIFIFWTITRFSPLVCTTITTTRKFFTILLSVLHFGHVFTITQWISIACVFGGLYLGIATKAKSASGGRVAVPGSSKKQD